MAIWRIFRRSPLSEENYPNRNPAWKQALLITDFQGNTRKGSSTSLSEENYPNRNPAWKQALLIADFQGDTRKGSSTSLSATRLRNTLKVNILQVQFRTWGTIWGRKHA